MLNKQNHIVIKASLKLRDFPINNNNLEFDRNAQ